MIVRAISWWRSGDRTSATRFAANLGRVFAYLFVGVGIFLLVTGYDPIGGIIEKLHEVFTQPKLIQPTFITDYPVELSPFAKRHRSEPGLVERFEGLRLVVAGDGPLRLELERAIARTGLARTAVFTGSIPHEQVPALIRSFDLALAPYDRFERPFYFSPLKLFEYMACGVPVVAADLGQIAEIVDGDSGLVYPAGDLEGLTAACEVLLGDPALRRRQGEAAAEFRMLFQQPVRGEGNRCRDSFVETHCACSEDVVRTPARRCGESIAQVVRAEIAGTTPLLVAAAPADSRVACAGARPSGRRRWRSQ